MKTVKRVLAVVFLVLLIWAIGYLVHTGSRLFSNDSNEDTFRGTFYEVNSKEYFLEIRNLDRTDEYKNLSNVQRASRFIYLNRTCFNGLYRVNSQGQFNVPFGNYKNPRIVDKNNLLNCSELLKNTEIKCADFSEILTKVKRGDFVYFDPPYVPLNETSTEKVLRFDPPKNGQTKGITFAQEYEVEAMLHRL